MKRIVLLITLLTGYLGTAQLLNPSSVLLVEGGILNPDAVEVTDQSVLTALSSQNKVLLVNTDFTLNSNVSVADGATVIGYGGVISTGPYDWLFNDQSFDSPFLETFIELGQNGTINSASTFKSGNIDLSWFGAVGDGNLLTNQGTDNRNVFMQASKITQIAGGNLSLMKEGNFLYSQELWNGLTSNAPANLYITGNSNFYMGPNTVLGTITNSLATSNALSCWRCNNSVIEGGEIVGDLRTHDFSSGVDEGNMGIGIFESDNLTIKTPVREFAGDCVYGKYSPQFVYLNAVDEPDFTKDNTITDTGTTSASSSLSYSTRWDITSPLFTNNGNVVFGGGSFAGDAGLNVQRYFIAWYDNTSVDGNTTTGFLGLSDELETYQEVRIPDNATHIRLIIYSPNNWSNLNGTIYSLRHSTGVIISPPTLKRGVREGISNPPQGSRITGIIFDENGRRFGGVNDLGTPGSPGFGINIEDGFQNLSKVEIDNNVFKNNWAGDIILKSCTDVTVRNNLFLPKDYLGFVESESRISSDGFNTSIYHNIIYTGSVSLSRNDHMFSNNLEEVDIILSGRGEKFTDHYNARDVKFRSAPFEYETFSYIQSSSITMSPHNTSMFSISGKGNWKWENMTFDWSNKDIPNVTATGELSSVGDLTENQGSFKNFTIKGITPEDVNASSTSGARFPAQDIDNLTSSYNVEIVRGLPDSEPTLSNSNIYAWFDIDVADYPNTNTGDKNDYPVYTIKNTNIIPMTERALDLGRHAFTTRARDFSVYWEGGSLDVRVGDSFRGEAMLDLNNRGIVTFKDVTFKNERTTVIDMNTAASSDTGRVYFIDCDFENVSITLRSIDKFLYTKAHPDLEVYADNAAAIAGGIPVGYMYKTTTGDLKIVY